MIVLHLIATDMTPKEVELESQRLADLLNIDISIAYFDKLRDITRFAKSIPIEQIGKRWLKE